jgi:hypothetical protein
VEVHGSEEDATQRDEEDDQDSEDRKGVSPEGAKLRRFDMFRIKKDISQFDGEGDEVLREVEDDVVRVIEGIMTSSGRRKGSEESETG